MTLSGFVIVRDIFLMKMLFVGPPAHYEKL